MLAQTGNVSIPPHQNLHSHRDAETSEEEELHLSVRPSVHIPSA